MADGLVCSRCGAPLPAAAAQHVVTCAYCGTSSTPPAQVEVRVVERVRIVAAQPAAGALPGALLCPRCGEALRDARAGDALARCCRACAGAWVESATVKHVEAQRDAELERAVRFAVPVMLPVRHDLHARIGCPVCAAELARVDIPDAGQYRHVCAAHGTWFDRGGLLAFSEACAKQRAGDVDDEALKIAGIPRKLW